MISKNGLFVAEGTKVVGDLLKYHKPEALFATDEWKAPDGISYTIVTEEELRRISFLQHPQQVLGLFPIPPQTTATNFGGALVLALDGVQDPGNLGTIIRIADWFGIETVYCSTDTADAWSPKVVQASMGSIARVHIIYTDLMALTDEAQAAGIPSPYTGHSSTVKTSTHSHFPKKGSSSTFSFVSCKITNNFLTLPRN